MIDENRRNPTAFWILFSLFLLVCFFLFPEPLPPEFTARPVWYKKITSDPALPPAGTDFTFSIGGKAGFFNPEGATYSVEPPSSAVLMGENSWLTLPPGNAAVKTVMNMQGEKLGSIPPAEIPFFIRNRLFSTSYDAMGLVAYSDLGKPLWNYTFPCQVSGFDANESVSVAGLIDGSVEILDKTGKQLLSFTPGGSRLQVILGISSSVTGNYVAMVSGIDRQRLVVLGRGDKDYRVVAHRYLESDFRTPVSVFILPDDRYVLYQQPEGIGVFSLDGKENAMLPVKAETFTVHQGYKKDLYFIMAKSKGNVELVVFSPPDRLLGRTRLPPETEFYRFSDRHLFLGYDSGLSRIDFKEE